MSGAGPSGLEVTKPELAQLFRSSPLSKQRQAALWFMRLAADTAEAQAEIRAALAELSGGNWNDGRMSERLRARSEQLQGEYLGALWEHDERNEKMPPALYKKWRRKGLDGRLLEGLAQALSGAEDGPEWMLVCALDGLEDHLDAKTAEAEVRQRLAE